MRARGGTRTGFQALQTLGTCENVRNPAGSGPCMTRSEVQGVHIVHQPRGIVAGLVSVRAGEFPPNIHLTVTVDFEPETQLLGMVKNPSFAGGTIPA
jgi:hypothetical protein